MLAIVIPYYKYFFFEATLQSLAQQTNKLFTVYIGDDASPENPMYLLERYKETFSYQYQRFDSNLGSISLTKQWERCLAMVEDEEWIMILGDDDTISDNFVEEFYTHLDEINQLKIDVIRFATIVINELGETVSKKYEHPTLETSTDFLMRKLKGGTRSSLSEFVFKRDVLDKIKFKNFPLAWYSDYLAVLECSKFSNIYTINKAIVSFRLSYINITGKKDDLVLKNVATFNYYYYLLEKKFFFFDNEQRDKLYFMLEKTFLDNKLNFKFWLLLAKLYITHLEIKRSFKLLSKVLNSILKKIKSD